MKAEVPSALNLHHTFLDYFWLFIEGSACCLNMAIGWSTDMYRYVCEIIGNVQCS